MCRLRIASWLKAGGLDCGVIWWFGGWCMACLFCLVWFRMLFGGAVVCYCWLWLVVLLVNSVDLVSYFVFVGFVFIVCFNVLLFVPVVLLWICGWCLLYYYLVLGY